MKNPFLILADAPYPHHFKVGDKFNGGVIIAANKDGYTVSYDEADRKKLQF